MLKKNATNSEPKDLCGFGRPPPLRWGGGGRPNPLVLLDSLVVRSESEDWVSAIVISPGSAAHARAVSLHALGLLGSLDRWWAPADSQGSEPARLARLAVT